MKQSAQQSKIFRQVVTASTVFASRLGALPANVSPVGSYGFFGNPVLYMAIIIGFDLFVKGLYPGVFFTYIGFAMYPLLGKVAGASLHKRVALLPLASFLFFIFSNLGVWWYFYDRTVASLLMCYTLALPFYGRTLLSDLTFGYGYLLWQRRSELIKNIRFNYRVQPQYK
jgi:hypothetical protein